MTSHRRLEGFFVTVKEVHSSLVLFQRSCPGFYFKGFVFIQLRRIG